MQIVEKPWEKVNLGTTAIEYIFEGTEETSLSDAERKIELSEGNFDYQVARVPSGCMGVVRMLQQRGFLFVETTIEMKCPLKKYEAPRKYQDYIDKFSYVEADENDLKRILLEIEKGIYVNERIALDPVFGLEKSSTRFRNWLQSEVKNATSRVFRVLFGENEIGYFALKDISPNEASSIQAALYKEWNDSGFGFSTLIFPIIEAKRTGKRVITTAVTSNNVISAKTHMSVGYQLTDIKYVFAKHNN